MENLYVVWSQEICLYPSSYGPQGPAEYGCCAIEVSAKNQREAKAKAIKSEDFKEWILVARSDDINPFVGIKAQKVDVPVNPPPPRQIRSKE